MKLRKKQRQGLGNESVTDPAVPKAKRLLEETAPDDLPRGERGESERERGREEREREGGRGGRKAKEMRAI